MLTKFPTSTSEIDGRLKQAFPALESAVREFRHHVPWWSKRGFNRAWLCYHCAYPDHGESGQRYHHYMPFSGTSNVDGKQEEDDNTKTYKENFKHNVGNLLKYARIT